MRRLREQAAGIALGGSHQLFEVSLGRPQARLAAPGYGVVSWT